MTPPSSAAYARASSTVLSTVGVQITDGGGNGDGNYYCMKDELVPSKPILLALGWLLTDVLMAGAMGRCKTIN